jgi:hypothetical protein
MTDAEALEAITQAFRSCVRPEHFTNFEHCEECEEHDETLRSKDIDTLAIEDIGNAGWDPMCFVSPQGFVYYLPALARLALTEPTYNFGWYGNIFFWQLISNGPSNERYMLCTQEQRSSVAAFVQHIIESRPKLIYEHFASDDALRAFQIWSGHEVA